MVGAQTNFPVNSGECFIPMILSHARAAGKYPSDSTMDYNKNPRNERFLIIVRSPSWGLLKLLGYTPELPST